MDSALDVDAKESPTFLMRRAWDCRSGGGKESLLCDSLALSPPWEGLAET